MRIDTYVIIVNYNSGADLVECVDSLKNQNYKNFKILVIDSNSQDDSTQKFIKKYPNEKLIKNEKNVGFAKGNNIGFKLALRENTKNIVLLNHDTITDKNWLKEGIKTLNSDSRVGIAQSKILLFNREKNKKTDIINTDGNRLHFLGFGYSGNFLKKDKPENIEPREIQCASGAAMFIKAEVLKRIGFFDPTYFIYHEDLDLSWRTKLAGYKIMLASKSIVWHKYSFSRHRNKFFYMERNRWLTILKNYQWNTIILLSPFLFLTEIGLLLVSISQGWFLKKIASFFSVLKFLPATLKSRKKIQKMRKSNDHEVISNMDTKIEFEGYSVGFFNIIFNWLSGIYRKILLWII